MSEMYKVTVKGTGHLNGSVPINKTVEMDAVMARKFGGSERYQVIEEFLKIHYPGVKVNPRNFGATIVPPNRTSKKTKSEKTETRGQIFSAVRASAGKVLSSAAGGIKGGIAGGVTGGITGATIHAIKGISKEVSKQKSEQEARIQKELEKNRITEETNRLVDFRFSTDLADIQHEMDQLLIALAGMKYSSDDDETSKVNNLAYDKLIQKYELGLLKLRGQANDNGLHVYYEKKLKQIKQSRLLKKMRLWILVFLALAAFGIAALLEKTGII